MALQIADITKDREDLMHLLVRAYNNIYVPSFSDPDQRESLEKFLRGIREEMPGVNKDGLEITLEGNEITIIGHRQPETLKADVLYRESRPMDYRRVFELDPAIDTAKISAKMEQGILTLRLPKTEKVKPRKISIT